MVSGTIDINTGISCYRATDPDVALSSSPGLEDTISPGKHNFVF